MKEQVKKHFRFLALCLFLATGFLFFTDQVKAETIFTDDFNSYDNGNLNLQGGWSGSSSPFQVQGDTKFEGGKAVKAHWSFAGSPKIEKSGNSVMSGRITIHLMGLMGGTTHPRFEIRLREGSNVVSSVRTRTGGTSPAYYDGDTGGYAAFGGNFFNRTWHSLQMEWRGIDNKIRYKFNDAPATDWHKGLADWSAGLDTLEINFTNGVGYIDLIEEGPPLGGKSPVLFLPGVMASRLYEGSEKRWEPSVFGGDEDVQRLYLDSSGKSMVENIQATEIIDELPVATKNIYKSLLSDLAAEKAAGEISDYYAFHYDWRLSLSDILASGDLETKLRELAGDSGTGKVNIIAHSNGGLLAKALINQLGGEASGLIDQVIFVGVPQIGTPQAVGALLHGYDMGLPFDWLSFVLSPERARDLAQNMPAIYQLLPFADYYNSGVEDSIISFEDGEATQAFIDSYGAEIDTAEELYDFILGVEGREAPEFEELENPAVANPSLLLAAKNLMQSIGSGWQAPSEITVHQIAGIGENTLSNITYKTVQECVKRLVGIIVPICLKYEPHLSYTPNEVIDGDSTVVVPSASAMSDQPDNVNRWWVNLDEHNRLSILNPRVFREHKDILEVQELRTFIFDNITSNNFSTLPDFIYNIQPNIAEGKRLKFTLHSPLSISAVDSNGNEIPDTHYKRYGEVQVLEVPAESLPKIILNGEKDGTFTLEIQEYNNGSLVTETTFSGLLSFTDTIAEINFPDGTIENAQDFKIDYNGDNIVDDSLSLKSGEVITSEPSLADLILALEEYAKGLDIKKSYKKSILKKIEDLKEEINDLNEEISELEQEINELNGKINKLENNDDIEDMKNDINDLKEDIEKAQEKGIKKILKKIEKIEKYILKKSEKYGVDNTDVEIMLELLNKIKLKII